MEENRADRKLIKNMKTGLFGSFAGIGDAIFWFTLLPISGSIAASLCKQHSILGPIFFLAFWILMAVSRVFFLKAGYKLGSGAISKLTENAKALTKGAGILGVMVVGAMIPSYVTFAFPEKLKLFGTVGVQSIFDSVIPNLLPALFVGILYYILIFDPESREPDGTSSRGGPGGAGSPLRRPNLYDGGHRSHPPLHRRPTLFSAPCAGRV